MDEPGYGWIRLSGLEIPGVRIGVYPYERNALQMVIVDVGLWVPISPAARSEKLTDTINYEAVADLVRQTCIQRYYPLLESICYRLAETLASTFSVRRVSVAVTKLGALSNGGVSVEVEYCP